MKKKKQKKVAVKQKTAQKKSSLKYLSLAAMITIIAFASVKIFAVEKEAVKSPEVISVSASVAAVDVHALIAADTIKEAKALEVAKAAEKKTAASRSASTSRTQSSKVFRVTAYDLSYDSCQKSIGHPGYGVTRSGYNLSGMTREEAMTIAVDPRIIPLGTKVRLTFKDNKYSVYNGVYTARDTGGGVKGSHIDLFMGDFEQASSHSKVEAFGVRKATVEILK